MRHLQEKAKKAKIGDFREHETYKKGNRDRNRDKVKGRHNSQLILILGRRERVTNEKH